MKLKNFFPAVLVAVLFFLCAPVCFAGETGHYVCGVEGIKVATIAPPGFYYKLYNVFYYSDTYKGRRNSPQSRLDIQDFIMVHRPIWVTKQKILGADFFFDLLVPITYADVSIPEANLHDKAWALGDICFEFFGLAWHHDSWDSMFSLAAYIPTGRHSLRRPALPGKDFWTLLVSPGGTIYLDDEKTWAISVLLRYEVHSKKRDENIRPGQDFSFDAAISKSIGLWDLGISGYGHWQLTSDRGSDISYDKTVHDRVFAIGPEVSIYVPFLKLKFQFRTQAEFGAVDRTEGIITNFSFTKMF